MDSPFIPARSVALVAALMGVVSCTGPAASASPSSEASTASEKQGDPSPSSPGAPADPSGSTAPTGAPSGDLPEQVRMYWDESGEPCHIASVTPKGTLILRLRGAERELHLAGIELPDPLPSGFADVIAQAPRRRPTLACIEQPILLGRPASVIVKYYSREDKAGPVWDDIGAVLVQSGVARVVEADIPDKLNKAEYLRRQARARAARRGIWAKPP